MHILIGPNGFDMQQIIPEIQDRHPDVTFIVCDDSDCVSREIARADAYCGWLTRETFLAAGKLRWVQALSTGVDSFLRIPELKDNDVILTNARGVHAVCLAEQTFAMIFGFTRGMKAFVEHQQRHEWVARELRGNLVVLMGSTMGIVGYGTVGHAIAARARAFGMRILAVDAFPEGKSEQGVQVFGIESLGTVLKESDYVVITVPLTPETHGMMGAEQVALLKPSAILVGISRGGIIDEAALADALTSSRLAAAALDVFETEPLPADSPLWDIPNLIVVPHAAGGNQFEAAAIRGIFKENVERFVRGDFPLRNEVNKQLGF